MPNGRNAGRLFADCENLEGYGASHSIVDAVTEQPFMSGPPPDGTKVKCRLCLRKFTVEDGKLTNEELPYA